MAAPGSILHGLSMICIFYLFGNCLMVFTVRDHMRVPWFAILLLTVLEAILVYFSLMVFWAGNLIIMFLFFLVFFKVVDVEPYKLMYISMVTVTYTILCNLLFFTLFGSSYTWDWTTTAWMTLIFAVTWPPMALLMRKTVWPRLQRLKLPQIRWLSILPAFVISINTLIASSHVQHLMTGYGWIYSLTGSLIALASMGVSLMVLVMMEKIQDSVTYQDELRMIDLQITAQEKRYTEMLQYADDIRIMRHDMRHHLRIANMLLCDGKYDELRKYLQEYDQDKRLNDNIVHSQNHISDLIIHHTLQMAKETGIEATVHCELPDDFWISDNDLSVLLGNLIENAFIACALQETGKKTIAGTAIVRGDEAIIRLENSCGDPSLDTPERRREKGVPVSSGYGRVSIRAIAAKYNGIANFEQKDGRFVASVLLYRPQAAVNEQAQLVEERKIAIS